MASVFLLGNLKDRGACGPQSTKGWTRNWVTLASMHSTWLMACSGNAVPRHMGHTGPCLVTKAALAGGCSGLTLLERSHEETGSYPTSPSW